MGGGDGSGGPPSRLRDLDEDVELVVDDEKSEERVPGDAGAGLLGKNHSDSSSWFALLMILNT